jgi:arylsulfatase A-like enzyme
VKGFELVDFLDEEEMSGLGEITDEPLGDAAARHLSRRISEPFLMVASFHNPHDICNLPQKPSAYPPPANLESAPPLPDNFAVSPREPEFITDARTRTSYGNEIALTTDFTHDDWRNYLHHYYRMVEKVDNEVGKLLDALESRGYDQDTWIIFTSDHGDGAAAHQWAAKLSLYQESVNVPFILTHFGQEPNGMVNDRHLVSGLDILPTFLDLAGMEIPPEIQGKSLNSLLVNPDTTWREYLVTELAIDPQDTTVAGRMITNGRYKYMIYSYGARNEQLFDLQNDPGETRNLANNSAYSGIRSVLRRELKEWIMETEDFFVME